MLGNNRSGLVLEGGGMRGIYTAGVLDVFMEQGIRFDGVLGVSAGAIHGCSYVAGQRGRNIRYYKKYCQDPRFISLRNLILTGDIVGEAFCYHEIPEKLEPFDNGAFMASGTEFYVGCSNLQTGKAEYLRVTDMNAQVDLLRASASLPFVSHTVEYRGMKLMDGGCTDSIPVAAMKRKLGFDRIVAVQTRQRGYKKESEFKPAARLLYRKYPAFVHALAVRHLNYNHEVEVIERLERERKIFVIRPEEELAVGRLKASPEQLQEIYDRGRADAGRALQPMKEWLAGEGLGGAAL